jgi:hypothetical protein
MVATVGAGWQLAPCLVALIREADKLFPNRSKASDGSIGDAAHASRGTASDHNPADGWVCAVDVTDDKANGCDADLLARHIVASRDPRVKYVIWNDTVVRSYDKPGLPAWTPEEYLGTNPHITHTHVSVHTTATARSDLSDWWPQEADDMPLSQEDLDKIKYIVAAEVGKANDSLYERIRVKTTDLRDSLAKLIRGDG